MAILKDGINGPFSGKIGSIVGYELNGQTIIRGLPRAIKRPPSALTIINRNRMKAVSKFLKPIKQVIKLGYKNLVVPGGRVGAFQTAQSYIFKTALDYDEATIPYVNPEKALIFRGDLPSPVVDSTTRDGFKLTIKWNAQRYADNHLNLLILAYHLENEWSFYDGGVTANNGQLGWELPNHFAKLDQIHIYVGFLDIFSGEMSDSVYAGCV